MTEIRPTKNRIFFQFVDDTSGGNFKNKTSWGFEFQKATDEIKTPRWGKVTHVGSEVNNVNVGQYVLIEPLMWTTGFETSGKGVLNATSADKLLAVSDERPIP